MGSYINKLRQIVKGDILPAEPLSNHTTYRVGGEAEVLVRARDSDEAAAVYRYARAKEAPLTVLGAGSNVIAPDGGVAGIVLALKSPEARIEFPGGGRVMADAGVTVLDLARAAAERGLSGLEDISGVPGTVGGAVFMNAKVAGEDTASRLESVEVVTPSGRALALHKSELSFGYRRSMFQGNDWLVLRAEFRLSPGDPETIRRAVDAEWNKWRSSFPLEPPNAGSVFKRPSGDYAGRLIEEAGCKGLAVGGARVWERHANFIHNVGGATAADILALIAEVRERVYRKSGVWLELEQVILPARSTAE